MDLETSANKPSASKFSTTLQAIVWLAMNLSNRDLKVTSHWLDKGALNENGQYTVIGHEIVLATTVDCML